MYNIADAIVYNRNEVSAESVDEDEGSVAQSEQSVEVWLLWLNTQELLMF